MAAIATPAPQPAAYAGWRRSMRAAQQLGMKAVLLLVTLVVVVWIPWLQFEPNLDTWRRVLDIREVRRALLNSAVIGLGGATLALVLGVPAAYAMARFRYGTRGNAGLTNWFLGQRIMPPVIFAPPIFILMRSAGLLDTLLAQILLAGTFNIAFVVLILSQLFRDIPIELEESAQVDGASRWEIFCRIALPLVAPGVAASWLIALAFSWNMLFFALVVATKDAIPMTVLIAGQSGTRGVDFPAASTMALFLLAPPTIIAIACQRYIVHGLALGAVKG
jgi:multiple sugar transport system permease protein